MKAIRQKRWRPTRTGLLCARLTAVMGMLATVAVGAVVASGQRAASDAALDRRVAEVTQAVTTETGRYVDTISTVAAAVGAVPELTASTFGQITAPIAGMNLAGATSLSYLVAADAAGIAAEQRKWRSRGATTLVLRPSAASQQHIFSVLITTLDGSPRTAGRDVTESAAPTAALQQARSSGQMAISDPFVLARDRGLSPDRRQQSFVLTSPVFGPVDAAGARPFRGWVVMGLRSDDFLGDTLDTSSGTGVNVTLRITRANGSRVQVTASGSTVDGGADMIRRAEMSMVGRRWTLDIDGSRHALTSGALSLPIFLTAGLLVSLLAGLLVLLRLTARAHPATTASAIAAGDPWAAGSANAPPALPNVDRVNQPAAADDAGTERSGRTTPTPAVGWAHDVTDTPVDDSTDLTAAEPSPRFIKAS